MVCTLQLVALLTNTQTNNKKAVAILNWQKKSSGEGVFRMDALIAADNLVGRSKNTDNL